jgi:hypothetical protein
MEPNNIAKLITENINTNNGRSIGKPVKVIDRIITEKVWMCPHCSDEIREKSLFFDGSEWSHRACSGVIILPD